MSESNNVNPWAQIYNTEFQDWNLLFESRSGSKNLYRFSTDELFDNFRLLFPIYHNSLFEDNFIKAKTMVNFIKEDYHDNLSPEKLRIIIDLIKNNFKKNDVIDIQKSFNIITLYIQQIWGVDPIQSDIASRQLLSAFGRKLGYCFESLSKPGLNRSDEFNSDDEASSSMCSCKSSEECSDCASEKEQLEDCSEREECECKSDEECSLCGDTCSCGSEEICSLCGDEEELAIADEELKKLTLETKPKSKKKNK